MCLKETWDKAILFLSNPKLAFKKEKKTTFSDSVKYLAMMSLVFAVLSSLSIGPISESPSVILVYVSYAVFIYFVILISSLLSGVWLHLWAIIFGAKKGVDQTIKTVIYASTPSLLLGWLPFIGVIFSVWTMILEIIGLKELHKIKTSRALAAVILSILVITFIILIFALAIILFVLGNFNINDPITGAFLQGI